MGCGCSHSIRNFDARIRTKNGEKFRLSYHDLVDHILLLRQVIERPEMTQEDSWLDTIVNDYCNRMARQEMKTATQQMQLPLEIEWIWHVHRLHPLNYHADCTKQLPDRKLVDKQVRQLLSDFQKKSESAVSYQPTTSNSSFIPSIDLKQAAIRQRDFLDKFRKHYLYSLHFDNMSRSVFEQLVQNYISFLKLGQQNEMIVPTFDIDIIWHTHMRYPSQYQTASIAICGIILNHDDAIESRTLTDAYKKTAERWKNTYSSEYGKNIDRKGLQRSKYKTSCAMVFLRDFDTSHNGVSSCGAIVGGCGSGCGTDGCATGGGSGGGGSGGGGGGSYCGGGGSGGGGGGSHCGGGGSGGGGCGGGSCGSGGGD